MLYQFFSLILDNLCMLSLQIMLIYCLRCKKDTGNIGPRKLIFTNKIVIQVSNYDEYIDRKSTFKKKNPLKILLFLDY